jgi:hypothetical protein
VTFASILMSSACSLCENEVVSAVDAPDGACTAVTFVRSCGATTGFSTHVSVLPARKRTKPEGGGNAFVADRLSTQLGVGQRGDIPVKLHWTSRDRLAIEYPKGVRVFNAAAQVDGVRIEYKESETQ